MRSDQESEADLLAAISELSFARNLARVTETVRTAARRLTGADGVTFVLREQDHCFYADEDAIGPLWKGRRFPMSACISGWVMAHGEPVAIPDIYEDSRIPHDAYRPTFVRSLLMVPVRPEDPIAAIGAYWATTHEASEGERRILETLARAASLALLNVQLWSDLQNALAREQRARAEAEDARLVAEEANRVKDQFLATVSHELRTPLNVMQGWLWQLRQPGLTPPQLERAVETLERNTALQARLVEDLLDVSRAVAGKLGIDPEILDLGAVARIVVEVSQPAAQAKGLQLSFGLEGAPPLIWGDSDRIQQIVWNLVSNAIKFTPAGGSVEVLVGRAEHRAVISVTDTGIGIDAEFLPHMFDQFRQAEANPSRHYGGLGIGLTIVQQLVRLHGGTVSAESSGKGRGATIRVELPIPAVRSEPGEWLRRRVGAATPAQVALTGLTLLVIDDEPEACEALRQILEQHGATVHTAESADAALRLIESVAPSLVVADLAMPGTDGFTFLRQLRRGDSGSRDVPAAALTALSGADYRKLAEDAGFQLYLQKPIMPEELAAKLARLARTSSRVH